MPARVLHRTFASERVCSLSHLPFDVFQADSEGIVKLWGEDALLDWPGALEPIIEERDMVMANVLRACASGMV